MKTRELTIRPTKTFLVSVDSGAGSTQIVEKQGEATSTARMLSTNFNQTSVWTWHDDLRGTRVVTFFNGEETFA